MFEKPSEAYKRFEEPVDLDKFTMWGLFKKTLRNADKHPQMSIENAFVYLFTLSSLFVLFMLTHLPLEWYYDWKDPLIKSMEDIGNSH